MRLISISEGKEHGVIKDNASYINTPDPRPTHAGSESTTLSHKP